MKKENDAEKLEKLQYVWRCSLERQEKVLTQIAREMNIPYKKPAK